MGVFSDAFTLYKRELSIFRKNLRTSVARSLIFPVVLILLLGNLGNTPTNIPVAVVNYYGVGAEKFITALQANNDLNVVSVTNQQEALEMLSNGQVQSVIVIPPDLGAAGQNIVVYIDASQPLSTSEIQGQVEQAATQSGIGASSVSYQSASSSPSTAQVIFNDAYGAAASYKDFLVAGIMIMVAAFGSMFSGGMTLLTDRQLGNLKTFFAAPINRSAILMAKIGMGVTQSMINSFIALGIGVLDGVTIVGGIGALPFIVWFAFLAALGFSGIATALASRINKIEVFSLISMAFTLPLWFLSGAFLPTSTLPTALQFISAGNPMTYGVNAVRDVMLKGYITAGAFLFDTTVLIVFAMITLFISIRLFKGVQI